MRFALINGLNGHYEMFGYFIEYCWKHGHSLDIYTCEADSSDWFDVYTHLYHTFNDLHFFIITETDEGIQNLKRFFKTLDMYDLVISTTDDDYCFINKQWSQSHLNKLICVDHFVDPRQPLIPPERHIATRPFRTNYRKWALPCFSILSVAEKQLALSDTIHVAIIGAKTINSSVLERITCAKPLTIHYITRNPEPVTSLKHKDIRTYAHIKTSEMMAIVSSCLYVITDAQNMKNHENGFSMSGAIPLAFSTLCRLVISLHNNTLYQFKTAIEFDLSGDEPIILPDTLGYSMLDDIAKERARLMDMLDVIMTEFV